MIIEKISKDIEEYFNKLVTDEFQGHQGLALKYLCDLHRGVCPNGHEELEFKMDILKNEIEQIKEQLHQNTESKQHHVKSLSGRIIK